MEIPLSSRASCDKAACDIFAGYERIDSTAPRLTAKTGSLTFDKNWRSASSDCKVKDKTAPADVA